MTDPVSAAMLAATVAGTGIQAFGQYQAGQATAAGFRYQADVNQKLAQIATQNANYDIAAGGIKAQQAGLVSGAAAGRIQAEAGAHNLAPTVGSTARTYMSQLAIGQENERILTADAAHAAYGEQVQAAEKIAGAGADVVAARTTTQAIVPEVAGTIATGAGSVASKWYQMGQYQGGPVANINPDSPEGRVAYASSIYSGA